MYCIVSILSVSALRIQCCLLNLHNLMMGDAGELLYKEVFDFTLPNNFFENVIITITFFTPPSNVNNHPVAFSYRAIGGEDPRRVLLKRVVAALREEAPQKIRQEMLTEDLFGNVL